jgi:Domain of unknown function (DUF4177)
MNTSSRIQWEYKVVWFRVSATFDNQKAADLEEVEKELNFLGSEGWELVFIRQMGRSGILEDVAYHFKRAKVV